MGQRNDHLSPFDKGRRDASLSLPLLLPRSPLIDATVAATSYSPFVRSFRRFSPTPFSLSLSLSLSFIPSLRPVSAPIRFFPPPFPCFAPTRPTLSQLVGGRRGVVQLPALIRDRGDNEYVFKYLQKGSLQDKMRITDSIEPIVWFSRVDASAITCMLKNSRSPRARVHFKTI